MIDADDRKARIKDDAKGAMAPSQADSRNDGAHSARPEGEDGDATREADDHSAPETPDTGLVPRTDR